VDAAVAGSGIGLAVVAQLVALHGGRAWAEGAPGKGARFLVELPLSSRREPGTGNGEQNGASRERSESGQRGASVPPSPFPVPDRS
jgi:hypothetical protein